MVMTSGFRNLIVTVVGGTVVERRINQSEY